jgi:type I restriction enzyme R subunit
LQDVYEILSPDAHLRPFMADYGELTRIYFLLQANYERGKPVDREFLRKTARLVQEHTESGDIEQPEKFHALTAEALEKIAGSEQPATVKVFNLLKILHELVDKKAGEHPYLISIGERAQQIAEAFEQRQWTAQQALEALEKLIASLKQAEKDRDATRLSPEAFAVYYLLKSEGVAEALKVAKESQKAFEQYPHWQTSERQEQDVRRSLYKALIDAGAEAVVELASKLTKLLRRAGS